MQEQNGFRALAIFLLLVASLVLVYVLSAGPALAFASENLEWMPWFDKFYWPVIYQTLDGPFSELLKKYLDCWG